MHTHVSRPALMLAATLVFAVTSSLAGNASATGSPASTAQPAQRAGTGPIAAPATDQGDPMPGPGWSVNQSAPGQYTVGWTSPTPLPVTDARPDILIGGTPATLTTLSADGRSVEATIDSAEPPSIADLDVTLSGQILDSGEQPSPVATVPYQRPSGLTEVAEDPGVPGTHEIERTDYELAPVTLPDITQQAEMLGHVVAPVDADATSPLVLFLHGRHSPCYRPEDAAARRPAASVAPGVWHCRGQQQPIPSYLGYDYVQALLASQGYVTVSISANAINDLDWHADDGGAAARAALIQHHLDAWVDFVDEGTYLADMNNVVLVGHSRGGEGVNRASINLPVSAPYDVTGQVLIGPTDFGFQASPYVPTVTLLPYCDGDVSDLQGQTFTDAARDLVADPIAFHSSVLVMGANHNFFNTEWTPGISVAPSFDDWWGRPEKTCGDDSDMRLSAVGQRKVGKAYIAGAVHLFADGDTDVAPMFDGSSVTVPSANNADVRSHAIGGGLDIRRPVLDSTLSPATGGASTRFCRGQAAERKPTTCDPGTDSARTPHWPANYFRGITLRRAFEMSWTAPDAEGGLTFDTPWDLSGASSLDLRTIVDPETGPAKLSVRLHDADGRDVLLTPEADRLLPLPGGGRSLSKRWAQTLRIPLTATGPVDLTAVTGVDLVSRNASGHVWVLDLSSRPSAGLPAPATGDVPWISIGKIRQAEGDAAGTQTVPVPYTVGGGTLEDDAIVTVVTVDAFGQTSGAPEALTIPAGTTSGSINVEYEPNTIDDPRKRDYFVAIYPVTGLATDRYIGGAAIIDDDPSPSVSVRPVTRRVAEGERLTWQLTLSAPTNMDLFGVARPVRGDGPGRQMTVGDLGKLYRTRHLFPVPPLDTPLWQTDLFLFGSIPRGRTQGVVSLPTLADDKREGARTLTVRFRVGRLVMDDRLSTIVLTDR